MGREEAQDQQSRALNVLGHDVRLLRVGADDDFYFLKIDGTIYGNPYNSRVNALEAAYRLLEARGFRRAG